jgi:hypothetical protein
MCVRLISAEKFLVTPHSQTKLTPESDCEVTTHLEKCLDYFSFPVVWAIGRTAQRKGKLSVHRINYHGFQFFHN